MYQEASTPNSEAFFDRTVKRALGGALLNRKFANCNPMLRARGCCIRTFLRQQEVSGNSVRASERLAGAPTRPANYHSFEHSCDESNTAEAGLSPMLEHFVRHGLPPRTGLRRRSKIGSDLPLNIPPAECSEGDRGRPRSPSDQCSRNHRPPLTSL